MTNLLHFKYLITNNIDIEATEIFNRRYRIKTNEFDVEFMAAQALL